MVLKVGSTGELVRILQELLEIKVDGIYGNVTWRAVKHFQQKSGLLQDGIVGPLTWKALKFNPREANIDTDREKYENWIESYHLPENEYVDKETSKYYIVNHHTAGRENPYKTIDHWANDNRGRVGTNYVIGGISTDGSKIEYDGKILQSINDEYYGWHIGPGGSFYLKEHSLSIEVCSAGGLRNVNGIWKTWFGEEVEYSQVCELKKPFRGYRAFQKYSEEQLKSLKAVWLYLANKHNINIREGMQDWMINNKNPFDWHIDAYSGKTKGMLNHTNLRKDKSDMFPQPELLDLIRSI